MTATLNGSGIVFGSGKSLTDAPDVFSTFSNTICTAGDNDTFYFLGTTLGASSYSTWQLRDTYTFIGGTGSVVRFRAAATRGWDSSGKGAQASYCEIRVNGTAIISYGNGGSTWGWSGNVDRTMTLGDVITVYARSASNGYDVRVGWRLSIAQTGAYGKVLLLQS